MASIRAHPSPASARASSRVAASSAELQVDHGVEQRRLGRVVVEDRLLADAQLGGQLIERGGLVAAGAEGAQGGRQHPFPGRHLPNGRGCLLEQGGDRRGPRRQAHLRHRHHRLPRHRPGRAPAARRARLRARAARPARQALDRRPAGRRGRSSRTTPSTACAPSSGGGKAGFDEMAARRVTAVAGDVSTDGLGLDDAGRAALASVRHRHPLRRHGVASTRPLDGAVEVNLLGPTRIAATLQRPRRRPPPGGRVHLLRGRQPPGLGARDPGRPRARSSSTSTGGARSTAPAGPAADAEAESRTPEQLARLPQGGPPRAGRRRHARCWPPRPSSCGRAGSSDRLVEAGRARAASLGWPDAYAYTKALGERALARDPGRRAGQHRAARRSSSRRWPSPARAGSAASAWPSR